MRIPLVDLKAQYADIKDDVNAVIQRVLNHTGFILGEEVDLFEKSFSDFIGTAESVAVASGTAALQLALLAVGVGPGDEVITTAHTFVATAEAISHTGARVVFVDIDPLTYNLDPNLVEEAITPRTRAIVPVHLYGQPAEMASILDIAHRHNLWVIEDAAQAHGGEYRGFRCGSMGHLGCFSFYPGKNLGAYGDAGAVTGNDKDLINKLRRLRDHGRTSKYEHNDLGYGERMDAIQAAILKAKLRYLEGWLEARRRIAYRYNELLKGLPVSIPLELPHVRHVYHLYVVRTRKRDSLLDHLKEQGIGAGIHYPIPLHRQPAYLKLGYGEVQLPETERAASEVLSLPVYPEMTDDQVEYVVNAIKGYFA